MGIDDNMSIQELIAENKKLKEVCDAYEEEHRTTFQEWCQGIKEIERMKELYNKSMDVFDETIQKLKEINDEYNS